MPKMSDEERSRAERLRDASDEANRRISRNDGQSYWALWHRPYIVVRIHHAHRNSYKCTMCGQPIRNGYHIAGYHGERSAGGYHKRWCSRGCARRFLETLWNGLIEKAGSVREIIVALENLSEEHQHV